MTPRQQANHDGIVYTPADVTAYIARSTIIPWLLDRCPQVELHLAALLTTDPERYLPPALLQRAPLPTETPREHRARREHCRQLRQRLRTGPVSVNDVVTWNLDGERLALDVLPDSPAMRDALRTFTILDPTCGDGAFLQEALRLVERLASGGRQPPEGVRASDHSLHLGGLTPPAGLFGLDVRPDAVQTCQRNLPGAVIRCGNAIHPASWHGAFPDILRAGGFDIILGNPPYVAANRAGYRPDAGLTADCPDVYAWVLERTAALLKPGGRCGMVVPLSLGFSAPYAPCRQLLLDAYASNWFASFGRIPSALFPFDVRVRNVIHLGHKADGPRRAYATRLHRWFDEARPQLFDLLAYTPFTPACWHGRLPKVGNAPLTAALEQRLRCTTGRLGDAFSAQPTPYRLYFKKTAYNWLTFCRTLPPCTDEAGNASAQTQFDVLYFRSAWQRDAAQVLLNGKWVLAWWLLVGDDFHVARWMLASFPADLDRLAPPHRQRLSIIARRLEAAMARAVSFKRNAGKRVGTYNLARCRAVTDGSDALWSRILGLEAVWPDVELLCAQVVRTDFAAYPAQERSISPERNAVVEP